MAKFFFTLIVTLASPAFAQTDNGPRLVPAAIEKVYIPQGFDDNDRVQVLVEGSFADTCYRIGPYKTRVDEANRVIFLSVQAYYYPGICLDMIVNYAQVINLGILRSSDYKIVAESSGEVMGRLPVRTAKTKNPDDEFYAPLFDANVTKSPDGQVFATVDCQFNSRCVRLKEIRVQEDGDHVITVLPIAEMVGDGRCRAGNDVYLFSKSVTVPQLRDKTGRYLLNARSLDGNSIFKLFELD